MFQTLSDWVSTTAGTLSRQYGVNPVVFGVLYFGTMPLFALSLAWWLGRWRRGASTLVPAFTTGLLFVGAYLYVLVAGRNLPLWVYVFMGAMLLLGAGTTWRQVQARRAPSDR
jgi:hypothetical protein